MEALRIAICGTGFIGRVHARSARLAGAEVVAVAASSLASAREAASDLQVEQVFATSEELVEAPGIDVVHLCTPNHLHEPLALKALAAGKHVVCEKPVAFDGAGATRIGEAAAAAGRVVTVPFVYRYHPMVREARARVAAGELGRLRLLHGSYQQDWLLTPDDTNWRVDGALGGPSRAFADIGSHWCDLVEFAAGHRITRLLARLTTAVPERAVAGPTSHTATFSPAGPGAEHRSVATEDVATVLFETDGGAVGTLLVSQISPGRKNRLWFELDGEAAAVVFDQEQPEMLWIGRRDGATVLPRDPAQLAPDAARLATLPAGHAQGYNDCFDLFVADTYAAIRGDAPAGLPAIGDGVRAATITDAVLASARADTWIEVPS
jgi:predicted dehydrogenase